ncbi:MAG: inositol monophosphatase family protein [Desulfobacter sp.]
MISFVTQVARQAGQICLKDRATLTSGNVMFKNPKDLVTETDRRVETFLLDALSHRYPDDGILGEETGATQGASARRWIIDPIDGTTSFVHNQPFYGISIALEAEGEIILGAVYAPVLDQMFYAEKGKGARLNDTPIRISDTKRLDQAVMATGFACLRAGRPDNNLARFNRIVPKLRDIRRYGSAALDLCYTACGRLDGYWEMNLNIYDIAAGIVILKEAGGVVSDFSGENHFPENGIVSANPHLHPLLLESLGG